MEEVREMIGRIAPTPFPVLITGSRGTGKELAAQEIHERSGKRNGPLVVVDCGALPSSLIESELFGHEAGTFTGAIRERAGLLELAHNGSLFLDEIGNMPIDGQAKLLRFLEDQKVRRVGGRSWIPVETRIIAATNRDLVKAIQEQRFMPDLYDRLSVLTVELPDLEERREDVPILAQAFIRESGKRMGREMKLDDGALAWLCSRPYPGNVRELKNLIFRMAALAEGDEVTMAGFERWDPRMMKMGASVH